MAAVPPSKMSLSVRCEAGVFPLPDNGGFAASLSWQGTPGTLYEESLGVKAKPWLAGVAHDLALCARAYHAGDKQLRGVQHAGSSSRGDGQRLNFPLACYVNQPAFWNALEHMTFGELAIKLRTSRELEKTLFFGNEWIAGLGEKHMNADAQQAQQPQHQRQQQHEPAAPARRGQQASSSLPHSSSSSGMEEHRRAPGAGAGAAPAAAAAGRGGKDGKRAVASPPAVQKGKAAGGAEQPPPPPPPQQQQPPPPQQQQGSSSWADKTPGVSPHAARKPATTGEPPAAPVPAAAAAGSPAAAGETGQANGGPATRGAEEPQRVARKQQHAAATRSPATSPSKRSQPAAANPGGVGAGPPDPLAARATQPATHGQRQQQQQQPQQPQQEQQPQQQQQEQPQQQQQEWRQQPQQEQQAQQQPVPPRPGKEAEPRTVWAKPAEFPAGTGRYPFYLKEGPLARSYFTVANEASHVLLGRHEGTVTLRDAATGKSWAVKTNFKRTDSGESRYFTSTAAFNRDNELRPHDVLWLSAGEPHVHQLLFGVWRWGSPEAAAFKAHLGSGKPGSAKKRTHAQLLQEAADVAAAAANGGKADSEGDDAGVSLLKRRQQRQQQQPAASTSSDDLPLFVRPRPPQGAHGLSPGTAKAAIEELFDDSGT